MEKEAKSLGLTAGEQARLSALLRTTRSRRRAGDS